MRLLFHLFLPVVLVAAPVPKSLQAKKTDAHLLAGRWVGVSLDGKPTTDWSLWVGEGTMSMGSGGTPADPAVAGPVVLNDDASPRQLDITWKGSNTPQVYIYKLDGDTLTMCHDQPNKPRPAEFAGGNGKCLFVFQRATEMIDK